MRATAKFLSKRAHKFARRIVDDDRFSAHARLVDRMRDVDEALFILRQSVRVPPDQSVRWHEPMGNASVGVTTGACPRQFVPRLVGRGKKEGRERSRDRALREIS